MAALARVERTDFLSPVCIGEVANVSAEITYTSRHSVEVQVNVMSENILTGGWPQVALSQSSSDNGDMAVTACSARWSRQRRARGDLPFHWERWERRGGRAPGGEAKQAPRGLRLR